MESSSRELSDIVAPILREAAFLAGEWVHGTEATVAVNNPADGTTVGRVPQLTPEHVEHAIEAALESWPAWRAKRADERARILNCWDALIQENREPLATLMTLEQGKPIAESRAETLNLRRWNIFRLAWFQ